MSDNNFNVNWFPGHMMKTKRQMEKDIKLVDAVAEIIDARIPYSSRNPFLSENVFNKPRMILLNKSDISDQNINAKWVNYYKSKGYNAILVDCKTGKGINTFLPTLKEILKDKINVQKEKGFLNPTMRVMIVGIPNVGKSSFINKINREAKAKTADKPGVTRGNQWFNIGKGFDLLDTPGVLWPKFEDKNVALNLALTGAIKDEIMDIEELALNLITLLVKTKPGSLLERYKIDSIDGLMPYEIMEKIALKRGMIISKGEVDYERVSIMLVDEFRAGKLGKLSLEIPEV